MRDSKDDPAIWEQAYDCAQWKIAKGWAKEDIIDVLEALANSDLQPGDRVQIVHAGGSILPRPRVSIKIVRRVEIEVASALVETV